MLHWVETILEKIAAAIAVALATWGIKRWTDRKSRAPAAPAAPEELPTAVVGAPSAIVGTVRTPPAESRPQTVPQQGEEDTLSPGFIGRAIRSGPPLGRNSIASTFVGKEVEWPLKLLQLLPNPDATVNLRMRDLREADGFPFVVCKHVSVAENSFLNFIHEGSDFRVKATIERVTEFEIALKPAQLTLVRAELG